MFGTGPYHNLHQAVILKECSDIGFGLFATAPIPKDTIVWCEREDGPSTEHYRTVHINEVESLSEAEKEIFIKYGYQLDENLFISPLTQEEVDLDYSNYFNHSCNPNVLPLDEHHWVAVRDINQGEQLTIDYCTFDSNIYNCISECKCGSSDCRTYIRGNDYILPELQEKYKHHFLPYIQEKIKKNN